MGVEKSYELVSRSAENILNIILRNEHSIKYENLCMHCLFNMMV